MFDLSRQIKISMRSIFLSPGILLLAVFSLGMAMTLNSALWSFRSALLVRPTVPEADRLMTLTRRMFGPLGPGSILLTEPQLDELAKDNPVFERMAGYETLEAGSDTGEGPVRTPVMAVTPAYFNVLGIAPFLGTSLGPGSPENGAVVSFEFWKRRLGSDPAVLGRTLSLDGRLFTVVAVLAKGHRGPGSFSDPEIYALTSGLRGLPSVPSQLAILGRPKSVFNLAQIRAHLRAVSGRFFPPSVGEAPMIISADPASVLPAGVDSLISLALWVVQALFLSVLGIALANVASLMLSRALERRHECAVCLSLGATRWDLARTFLVEGVLLAFGGTLLGLVLLRILQVWISGLSFPDGQPVPFASPFSPSVLMFSLLMLAFAGILAGILPARHAARVDLLEILKSGSGIPRSSKAQGLLVLGQVAASMLLLVVSCLFALRLEASLVSLKGFETQHGLLFELDASLAGMNADRATLLRSQVLDRLSAMPGLKVGATSCYTPDGAGNRLRKDSCVIRTSNQEWRPENFAGFAAVSPGYQDAIGAQCLSGRGFEARDQAGAEDVAVVNEAFALKQWPGGSAVGQMLDLRYGGLDTRCRVIGVIANHGLASIGTKPYPWILRPLAQVPRTRVTMVVRTPGSPDVHRTTLIAALRGLGLPAEHLRSLSEHFRNQLWFSRLAAIICGASGLFALVLSCAGLHALMRHQVIRRRREIGLRMALGARLHQITALVLGKAFRSVLMGLVAGTFLAVAAAKLIGSTGGDAHGLWLACLGAALLLCLSGLMACLIPTWKAIHLPPSEALRSE